MSLNAIITQAVNAQIEAFIQRLHKDRPKLKVDELREVWEEISGSPIEFAHIDNPNPKKTSVKKPRDPNAPKKKTGYMLFSEEHREQVKEENPDISFGQISKELGTMWKALSEKKREKYNERASVITEERKAHPEKGCSYKFSKGIKIGKKCGAPVKENGLCNQHKPKPKAKPAKVVSDSESESEKEKKKGSKGKKGKTSEPEKEDKKAKKGKGKISEPEKEKSVELSEEELEEEKKEEVIEKEVSEEPSENPSEDEKESEESSEEKIKDSEEESESEEEKKEKKGKNSEAEKDQTCMVEMKGKRKGELCGKPLGKGLSTCTYHEKQKSK